MARARKPIKSPDPLRSRGRPARAGGRHRILDVTVLLLEDGYASTAIAPIEVFHAAGLLWNGLKGEAPQPRFRVRTASIDGRPVKTVCSLGLVPELSIRDIERTDIVILTASGLDVQERLARSTPLIPWVRKMHERGAYIAGICSGVAFLAEAGLLDGREATTHWAVAESLASRYPGVSWRPEQFVTEDSGIFCSGGVYAAIDVSLHIVEKVCGREVALQCAKALLVSMPRGSQAGFATLPPARSHDDHRVAQAEAYLRKHFDAAVSIDSLARRAAMSSRNFIRRFKAATGRLPGEYLQMLRVSAAKTLLENEMGVPIHQLCARIGYEDVAFFRDVFRRYTGMTPGEYRDRFAGMSLSRGEVAGD